MSSIYLDSTSPTGSRESTPSPRKGKINSRSWTIDDNPLTNWIDRVFSKSNIEEITPKSTPKIEDHRVIHSPLTSIQPSSSSAPIKVNNPKQHAVNKSHEFIDLMRVIGKDKENPQRDAYIDAAFPLITELQSLEKQLNMQLIDPEQIKNLNVNHREQLDKKLELSTVKKLKKEISDFCKTDLLKANLETLNQLLDEARTLHRKLAAESGDSDLELPIAMLEQFEKKIDLTKAEELDTAIRNYCNTYLYCPPDKDYEEELRTKATVLNKKLDQKYDSQFLETSLEILRQTTEQNNQ